MVERAQPGEAGGGEPAGSHGSRVWQACVACRRKKVKCDGKQPCHNCSSREHACEFPATKDNASVSRQYTLSFEARCQQMDSLCARLETLANQLSQSVAVLNRRNSSSPLDQQDGDPSEELIHAAELLRSMPDLQSLRDDQQFTLRSRPGQSSVPGPILGDTASRSIDVHEDFPDTDSDENAEEEGESTEDAGIQAGALITDSYGRLRFVGGTTNNVVFEAVKSLSPENGVANCSPSTASSSARGDIGPEDSGIPPLIGKRVWPELPFLPRPEQLPKMPQYASDLLIGLYFDKLHHSFPILHKPHFMERYRQMGHTRPSEPILSPDSRFISVYYAVCACASTLMPSTSDRGFPGIEYYEKAVLLYYTLTGEASLERVQCLGLLAMCTAGWNTMTQSWFWAGQAVRAAQDMGLHLSYRLMYRLTSPLHHVDTHEASRQQMFRRVWWGIYCLDKVVSMCLGRPTAAQDRDCSCELPLDLTDEDLQSLGSSRKRQWRRFDRDVGTNLSSTWMAGFLYFARICRISNNIQRLGGPARTRDMASSSQSHVRKFSHRIESHEESLRSWYQSLPDDLRFPPSTHKWCPGGANPAMQVMLFTLHVGARLNLYLISAKVPNCMNLEEARSQTIYAARSLISAAGLVRDLVPQSHYLAFCLHYMMIAGIVLIRSPEQQLSQHTDADIEQCVFFFKDMEPRCSAANRYRAIIEQLRLDCRQRGANSSDLSQINGDANAAADAGETGTTRNSKRRFHDLEAGSADPIAEGVFWNDIPGWDMFPIDTLDPGLFSPVDGAQMVEPWGE